MIPRAPRGRPRRNQGPPTEPPIPDNGENIVWAPNDNSTYQTAVVELLAHDRPESTKKAYDPKIDEYYSFCELAYPNDRFACALNEKTVFKFMFYQVMRGKKKRGGRRHRQAARVFDIELYNTIMAKYDHWIQSPNITPPQPEDPLSHSTIAQYKSALRLIYKDQVARGFCNLAWPQIWTLPLDNLHQWSKRRQAIVDKRNYREKLDHDFSPYHAVEEFPKIEKEMWENGNPSIRSAYAWLRHRFCLLFSTSGILRCESLYKAELSDFMGVSCKKETDVHRLYLMIMQIATGKYKNIPVHNSLSRN